MTFRRGTTRVINAGALPQQPPRLFTACGNLAKGMPLLHSQTSDMLLTDVG